MLETGYLYDEKYLKLPSYKIVGIKYLKKYETIRYNGVSIEFTLSNFEEALHNVKRGLISYDLPDPINPFYIIRDEKATTVTELIENYMIPNLSKLGFSLFRANYLIQPGIRVDEKTGKQYLWNDIDNKIYDCYYEDNDKLEYFFIRVDGKRE